MCKLYIYMFEVYSIQHYVIKFVSDLWQIGCFLLLLRFPPPIKLTSTIFLKLLKVALNTIILPLFICWHGGLTRIYSFDKFTYNVFFFSKVTILVELNKSSSFNVFVFEQHWYMYVPCVKYIFNQSIIQQTDQSINKSINSSIKIFTGFSITLKFILC